jgi:hypothetical protein
LTVKLQSKKVEWWWPESGGRGEKMGYIKDISLYDIYDVIYLLYEIKDIEFQFYNLKSILNMDNCVGCTIL